MHRINGFAGGSGLARVGRITARVFSFAMATSIAAIAPPSLASDSDPVRNMHPEERVAQGDVVSPIYFVMPVGNAGDVTSVAPEAMVMEFMEKHTAMNYPAAVESAMRLIEAVPDRPIGYYNLACAQARLQRTDEAMEALRSAVARGWRDEVHMNIDPDLATLRSDARYAEIIQELRVARDRERITPTPLRSDSWEAAAEEVARRTSDLLARYHVPGAQVALIHDGQIVWSAAFGRRDMRNEDVMGVDDRFRLRAPLHMLAIAACEQLQQEDKMELAALIVEAANERGLALMTRQGGDAGGDGRGGAGGVVGVASNTQSASLREERPVGIGGNETRRADQERVAMVMGRMRSFARDSVYGFLRIAAEDAAESPFPKYCERSIFPQLDLRQSEFGAPDESKTHSAVGHSVLGTPLRPSVVAGEFAPGGSIHTTAGDVGRLIAAAMVPTSSTQVVPNIQVFEPTLVGGQFANAVEMVTQADIALAGTLGLALQRAETRDGVRMQLDESASGIVCLARWYPAQRLGVVVLCNSASGKDAAERIAHIALGGE